jgi:hypothetical protein
MANNLSLSNQLFDWARVQSAQGRIKTQRPFEHRSGNRSTSLGATLLTPGPLRLQLAAWAIRGVRQKLRVLIARSTG